MDHAQHSSLVSFIWNIADDVLRDVYVRGHYRDVILPMTVIRRLDAMLEENKQTVLDQHAMLNDLGLSRDDQDGPLRQAAGLAFYNTSAYTLRDLKAFNKAEQLTANFRAYLEGFSPNVQTILEMFKFYNQIPTLAKADLIGILIDKFLDHSINMAPNPVLNDGGSIKLAALDNHTMGTIFEELIRKFNEENNE